MARRRDEFENVALYGGDRAQVRAQISVDYVDPFTGEPTVERIRTNVPADVSDETILWKLAYLLAQEVGKQRSEEAAQVFDAMFAGDWLVDVGGF